MAQITGYEGSPYEGERDTNYCFCLQQWNSEEGRFVDLSDRLECANELVGLELAEDIFQECYQGITGRFNKAVYHRYKNEYNEWDYNHKPLAEETFRIELKRTRE